MAPREDLGWTLDLQDDLGISFASFDIDTIAFVRATLVPAEQREASKVVTGVAIQIKYTLSL